MSNMLYTFWMVTYSVWTQFRNWFMSVGEVRKPNWSSDVAPKTQSKQTSSVIATIDYSPIGPDSSPHSWECYFSQRRESSAVLCGFSTEQLRSWIFWNHQQLVHSVLLLSDIIHFCCFELKRLSSLSCCFLCVTKISPQQSAVTQ